MPASDLKLVQIGQETGWGTTAVATARLMGVTDVSLTIVDQVHQSERMGVLYPDSMVAEVSQHGEGSLTMELSYDDILYPLDGLFEEETPTGGPVYVWTYVPPTTTALSSNDYTFEIGTSGAEYECVGATFTGMTINGEAQGVWTAELPWFSKAVDDAAMTALTDRTVELIRMADTVLTIDAWGGTIGTTAIANELISFSLNIETGRHLKFFNGSLAPADYGETKWTGTLDLSMEYGAVTKAIVDALSAPGLVQRCIQLEATSGADIVTIDFYGTLMGGVDLWGDRDGNMTADLSFTGTWHVTDTDWLKIVVTNSLGTLV